MKSNFLKNINKYISFICSMKICCRQLCTLVSEDLYNQDADKINETAISEPCSIKLCRNPTSLLIEWLVC